MMASKGSQINNWITGTIPEYSTNNPTRPTPRPPIPNLNMRPEAIAAFLLIILPQMKWVC
ncbi:MULTISPECIES: hypothetical protein [unclassified Dehalobacter]|uniref:hypothetical protein n=1 Tax=unclassified Dehalobacter TaxID=2635733 RepID=UPI00143C8794|nr:MULTISPECIES: hypothetical protein [unclassified Dehalobacter]